MSPWLRIRRVLDPLAAGAMGVVLAPIALVIGILVRSGDGGRMTVGVPRVGRSHRQFTMWKFRSMRAAESAGGAGGSGLTATNDIRITPLGRRIRRFHLDEIPQIANVVRGEMSLIGPRPESPLFVDAARHSWDTVLSMPPGIAGAAQIVVEDWEREFIRQDDSGEDYMSNALPAKLAIDEWYVRNASPIVDALIVATLAAKYLPIPMPTALIDRIRREVPESRPILAWLLDDARVSATPTP